MKPFPYLVRRTHLYLALFCLPWIVMYGISSIAFTHPEWFDVPEGLYNTSSPHWTVEGVWPCDLAIPEEDPIPRAFAAELLRLAELEEDAYGAYRGGPDEVNVYFPEFWNTRRLTYRHDEHSLTLYSRKSIPQHILTGMHARAGYQHDSLMNDAWALMVDIVCIGFILWVATGLYIWWQLEGLRKWGAATLIAGFLSFLLFMLLL